MADLDLINSAVLSGQIYGILWRALPNAPDGYTPQGKTCPVDRPSIRNGSTLSTNEITWLEQRRNVTLKAMMEFMGRLGLGSLNTSSYIEENAANASALPNIGIAASGGGYRALMNGGGALQAFDSRTINSSLSGHLGGILQSATYLTGLSGGSWLVGTIYLNNFTDVTSLRDSGTVWLFQDSIFVGPTQSKDFAVRTSDYFTQINDAVTGKSGAGYNSSITDYWGRALAYQLINATEGGVGYTWSSIALSTDFQRGDMPMPIVVADGRAPGQILIPNNTTVFEFNPWELGTFNPPLEAFVPLEFLASNFSAATLPADQQCVRGFDNAGFVMGTSSSLFNQAFLMINNTQAPQTVKNSVNKILGSIGANNQDIAVYEPNPFYLYTNQSEYANSSVLTLVDGGEDLQNIPLEPLLQPQRKVDVILALDSSADTSTRWPNGTAMVATYQRSLSSLGQASGLVFPSVPDQNTFVNLGLNNRPTFFGCNSSNISGSAPLVVYIPNTPYSYQSNVSTFDLQYNTTERDAIIENGYDVATLGNATIDPDWPTCLGCAILSRSLERTNTTVPESCTACFQRYCWNGTTNSSDPGNYYPAYKLPQL
ncbi:Lysophospholipase [Penicillium ucsense]|uniref:Lysophospholipase n=1 Tax=Penicillium ucsense TaxID=2839758 RepID=A0A8J8VVS0_9EURO|nr:Lysophospholipase [Penicillium ucsense]KAF7726796.1 Lysophospholipase [Penicillium ucsense]